MIGSLRVGRRGATSKIGFDHVGEDGARFDDVESSDGRVHLVETLAAAQKFGIDRAYLVERLAQFAEVGPAAALVGLDQRAAQYLFDRRQAAREPVAAFAQGCG
jgi:hypothetical protein